MSLKPLAFFTFLSMAMVVASCKKSGGGPAPVSPAKPVQFTINGSAVNYSNCFDLEDFSNGNFEVIIEATNAINAQPVTNLQIRLVIDASGLKAGQTFPVATSGGQIGTSMLYYTPDGANDFESQYSNAQGSVTITSVTSKMITGTFSGKLFAVSDTNGTTVVYTITNGSFQASG
jgi:hypothetical protein